MTKDEVLKRLELIVLQSSQSIDRKFRLDIRDWEKNGKFRTYFTIIVTRENTKMYKKCDYGYFDNVANEYVAGTNSLEWLCQANIRVDLSAEVNTQ